MAKTRAKWFEHFFCWAQQRSYTYINIHQIGLQTIFEISKGSSMALEITHAHNENVCVHIVRCIHFRSLNGLIYVHKMMKRECV